MKSLINNIGFDGSGVHCDDNIDNKYENKFLDDNFKPELSEDIGVNRRIIKEFGRIFKRRRFNYIKDHLKKTRMYKVWKKV